MACFFQVLLLEQSSRTWTLPRGSTNSMEASVSLVEVPTLLGYSLPLTPMLAYQLLPASSTRYDYVLYLYLHNSKVCVFPSAEVWTFILYISSLWYEGCLILENCHILAERNKLYWNMLVLICLASVRNNNAYTCMCYRCSAVRFCYMQFAPLRTNITRESLSTCGLRACRSWSW